MGECPRGPKCDWCAPESTRGAVKPIEIDPACIVPKSDIMARETYGIKSSNCPGLRWPAPPKIDGCCTSNCPWGYKDICYTRVLPDQPPPRICQHLKKPHQQICKRTRKFPECR